MQAKQIIEILRDAIEKAESMLGENSQIVCTSVSSGEKISVSLIGTIEPDIILLFGKDDSGCTSYAFQHASQANILIRTIPWDAEKQPERNRIGFTTGASIPGDP